MRMDDSRLDLGRENQAGRLTWPNEFDMIKKMDN